MEIPWGDINMIMKKQFGNLELRIEKTSWSDLMLHNMPYRNEEFAVVMEDKSKKRLYSFKYPFLTYSDAIEKYNDLVTKDDPGSRDDWVDGWPACYMYDRSETIMFN